MIVLSRGYRYTVDRYWSGFCSIHFTVTLAGLKNVNRYTGIIVISKIVISGFNCTRLRLVNEQLLEINQCKGTACHSEWTSDDYICSTECMKTAKGLLENKTKL